MPEKRIKARRGVAANGVPHRSPAGSLRLRMSDGAAGRQDPEELEQASLLQQIVKTILKVNWCETLPYLLYLKIKGTFTIVPVAEEENIDDKGLKVEDGNQSSAFKNPPSTIHHPLSAYKKIFPILAIFILGLAAGQLIYGKATYPWQRPPEPITSSNKYVAFLDEVYDTIQKNYWNKLNDDQLNQLYLLGTAKLISQSAAQNVKNRNDLNQVLEKAVDSFPDDSKKEEFTTTLADMILANLEPFGRSRLYGQKEETSLQNNVANINPEVNRYQELGVSKNASQNQIAAAFQKQEAALVPQAQSSPAAKQRLAEITQAYNTLSDTDSRKVYDTSGVEPTMEYKLLSPDIFYIHQTKFSPTTLDELQRITQRVDDGDNLHTLIFDMRDNVGGAIDLLPYILGPFIGPDQYAYQFYHQGDKQDFKTLTSWMPSLVRYKQVVILINGGTQSSAEVMAAVLKKYNVGVLVGTKTAGWGTVEKVFPLTHQIDPSQKFSAFLVHSLTLRDDGQPIQGNGVLPTIDTSKPDWENELYTYYNSEELVAAVKNILNQ